MNDLKTYQIPFFLREALKECVDEKGNLDDKLYKDTIDIILGSEEVGKKLEKVRWLILDLDSKIALVEKESERLSTVKNAYSKKRENLVKLIKEMLESVKDKKIDTGLVKFSFKKSKSVNIYNIDSIPQEYKVEKKIISADKNAIKKAIDNGENIKGAEILVNKNLNMK